MKKEDIKRLSAATMLLVMLLVSLFTERIFAKYAPELAPEEE